MTKDRNPTRGEVLVAILKEESDLTILLEQKWYRIPVAKKPKRWPPQWLAFYQGKQFGRDAYAINYYGRAGTIDIVGRRELFPDEPPNEKSDRRYYRVQLESVERLPRPIYSNRPRRIVFIPTTWEKFGSATEINDLFDDSRLEDTLWEELRRQDVDAERQWGVEVRQALYQPDFAVFCKQGKIAIEVDGDLWHHDPERAPRDNKRSNALASIGWHVLRFSSRELREAMHKDCTPSIKHTIDFLGGLSRDGYVPRKHYRRAKAGPVQLPLFEDSEEDNLD